MTKPNNISIPNKEYYAWEYQEQTQIKHNVLKLYYVAYASKLGRTRNTLFFDCHGGCGVYVNGDGSLCYGSSILVHDAVQQLFANRSTKNHIIICEQEKENYNNLNKVLKDVGIYNDRVITYNCDYNNALKDASNVVAYKQNSTLFFVDPFGYYDTPMAGFRDLMIPFGNEILINFMFDFLNRGIGVSTIKETQLSSFFGSEEWKNAKGMSGSERESFLVNLYKNQLKNTTGARFVFAYRLCYPNKNQTYYYLIHATNHIDGISLMKSNFASQNNGRVEYLGKRNDEISLFDLDYYKQIELTNFLTNKFKGECCTFIQLLERIIEDTATIEKELRSTLKNMEKNNIIEVERITSKTLRGLSGDDIICFRGNKQ